MVWNRTARRSGRNRPNPVAEWIWSPEPAHEQLIDLETFVQAQQVAAHRFGSRTDPGPSRHPQTRRVYPLRTYLFCDLCGRRMAGGTRRGRTAYYGCTPKKGYRPPGHPPSTWVREDALLCALHRFLARHVFGEYRRALLAADLRDQAETAAHEHAQRIAALHRAITDADNRGRRLARNLELVEDPDQDFIRDLNQRRAELRQHRARLEAQLARAYRASRPHESRASRPHESGSPLVPRPGCPQTPAATTRNRPRLLRRSPPRVHIPRSLV